jgi:AAA ATPase domain
MANNPFRPGVGKPPPYLADREAQLKRFRRYLDDFPENRRNVRVTGLRGVGKTVLIKEYRKAARARGWIVIKRDLTPRLNEEVDFATAITADLEDAIQELSMVARLGRFVNTARESVSAVIDLGEGVAVKIGAPKASKPAILEDRIRDAMVKLGLLARKAERGVLFLYDEAHVLYDRPRAGQFPLSALLSGFVEAQDHEDDLPVMLVMSGLPPLATNLQAARSHSERFFKVEELGNLRLEGDEGAPSPAAAALTRAVESSEISFPLDVAERVAADVSGYPYFIQWYGEALWDAADDAGLDVIEPRLYGIAHESIQDGLDTEFFEGRYEEAKRAEQTTLRIAGSLGGENFRVGDLVEKFSGLKPGAVLQSLNRLAQHNLIYRVRYGEYAYTAPLFGDFLRRRHPRQDTDG